MRINRISLFIIPILLMGCEPSPELKAQFTSTQPNPMGWLGTINMDTDGNPGAEIIIKIPSTDKWTLQEVTSKSAMLNNVLAEGVISTDGKLKGIPPQFFKNNKEVWMAGNIKAFLNDTALANLPKYLDDPEFKQNRDELLAYAPKKSELKRFGFIDTSEKSNLLGAGCFLYYVDGEKEQLVFAESDGAWVNIDGEHVQLISASIENNNVWPTEKGQTSTVKYEGDGHQFSFTITKTSQCEEGRECGGESYSAIMEINSGEPESITASGECGC